MGSFFSSSTSRKNPQLNETYVLKTEYLHSKWADVLNIDSNIVTIVKSTDLPLEETHFKNKLRSMDSGHKVFYKSLNASGEKNNDGGIMTEKDFHKYFRFKGFFSNEKYQGLGGGDYIRRRFRSLRHRTPGRHRSIGRSPVRRSGHRSPRRHHSISARRAQDLVKRHIAVAHLRRMSPKHLRRELRRLDKEFPRRY